MELPKKDSATWRGLITGGQSFVASIPVIAIAVWVAIRSVPGCEDAVMKVIFDNIVLFAGSIGVGSGTVSFVWNLFRKDVKNY